MTTRNLDARLSSYSPTVLSIFRIVVGFLFAINGSSKLFGWPLDIAQPAGSWPAWWAGLIELVTGLLVLIGLFTRPAAFIASGEMAVAYFWQHQPNGLWPLDDRVGGNGGELAVLFCFAFFLLVFIGGGAYALDARRRRRVGTTAGRATADRATADRRGGRFRGWRPGRFARRY